MSKISDPLLDKDSEYHYEGGSGPAETLAGGWTTEKLAFLSHNDNQHADGKARESNNMIINDFGGIDNIIAGLETSATTGIDPNSIARRIRIHGDNAFPPPYIKGLCELIMENFNDPINVILCVAAVVSIIIGIIREGFPEGLTEGLSIMIALVIIFVVNSANNYSSERQLAAMM